MIIESALTTTSLRRASLVVLEGDFEVVRPALLTTSSIALMLADVVLRQPRHVFHVAMALMVLPALVFAVVEAVLVGIRLPLGAIVCRLLPLHHWTSRATQRFVP